MAFASYIEGNLMLFKFYLKHIETIRSLPLWMRNPDVLRSEIEQKVNTEGKIFELKLPSKIGKHYNNEFDKMKSDMRKLHGGEKEILTYKITLLLLFCIRILCIGSAWNGNVVGTIFLASLQFLVAPYSFFVSAALAIALAPPIYASHYIAFSLIQSAFTLISLMLPALIQNLSNSILPFLNLPINAYFILAFFIYDQLLCYYVHYYTPSRKYAFKETMIHVVWGFLNTKTYTIVILLHMMNSGKYGQFRLIRNIYFAIKFVDFPDI